MIRPCLLAAAVIAAIATPAHAELNLCNRTSYRVEAAIGMPASKAVSTVGWFRIDPGQCRRVLERAAASDLVYVHVRTPAVYGAAPLPQNGQTDLCVGENNFAIADARTCNAGRFVRFAAIKPSDTEKGPTAYLAEEADYDDAQARLAGIQRLLEITGYDASPIDGVAGAKTDAAIAHFLKDRKLPANAPQGVDFFDKLVEAAEHPEGHGFAWCNETTHTVMAAFGIVEMGSITARGWYRIESGQCLRPDIHGDPHRLYSYAEAVDGNGQTIMRAGEPEKWGGNVMLCVRDGRFDISNHKDCAARGLTSAGFAAIDIGGKPATTVRFKEP
ncbi:MAG TPA: DUF1036 domain-containing protein [Pseudolabrys sp.]|nr:DUF1036 domain-containing protein [Pseudolabrys sp.]